MASMILGFVFQISALRFGPLALVHPILALELLLVFGDMTVIGRRVTIGGDGLTASTWVGVAALHDERVLLPRMLMRRCLTHASWCVTVAGEN
jgi:hypothetical protein